MFRWLAGKGASQRDVARREASIADDDWRRAVDDLPFLAGLDAAQDAELRRKAAWVLASKTFTAAHDLTVTDEMRLSIAIQAALPILNLDTAWYEGWVGIILYPGAFLIPKQEVEESGVVHEYMQEADGEAWEGGPVILSWQAADPGQPQRANVVIHEFAHKLDLCSGDMDGMPSLTGTGISAAQWMQELEDALADLEDCVAAVEAAIPPDMDPESPEADPWYDSLPMDTYAATDPVEFFAVSSETFFVDPAALAQWRPQWYAMLARFYRQDPLARWQAVMQESGEFVR